MTKTHKILLTYVVIALLVVCLTMVGHGWQTSYAQSPDNSRPLMKCQLLKPNYRGMIFDTYPETKIEALVQLNLKEHNLTLDDVSLYARFGMASRKDIRVKKSIEDLKSDEIRVTFELEPLPVDDYILAISLRRKNAEAEFLDEQLAFKAFRIKRIPDADQKQMTLVKSDGSLLVNGKPFFPLGICLEDPKEENLRMVSELGLNCILAHNLRNSDDAMLYLNRAAKYGLKVIFPVRDDEDAQYPSGKGELSGQLANEFVASFKDHPALLAWYMDDEPENGSPNRLESRYQLVKTADPNHPIFSLFYQGDDLDKYLETSDFIIPQIFQGSGRTKQESQDLTFEEKRRLAYLVLVNGAKGLIFCSYTEGTFNQFWNETKQVVEEIRSFIPDLKR